MNSTIIQGYGVESKKLDLEITRKTAAFLKSRRRPIQFGGSAPVMELLRGTMDLRAFETCVRNQKATLPEFDAEKALGLVIPDIENPRSAVAFRLHEEGEVTPGVTLKVRGSVLDAEDQQTRRSVWVAEACAFKTDTLASSMIAEFNSPSVAALLQLTRSAFAKMFAPPEDAFANFEYLSRTGKFFAPVRPDNSLWTIAEQWPGWQKLKMGCGTRSIELASLANCALVDETTFRKRTSVLGLLKGDRTDGGFASQICDPTSSLKITILSPKMHRTASQQKAKNNHTFAKSGQFRRQQKTKTNENLCQH